MSDILIRDMEMPKEGNLTLQISANGAVYVVNSYSITAETYTTDAVPVPPHGDLIDRDKLREKEFIHDGDAYAVVMSRDIRNAPTIIPASEGGE